MHVDKWAAWLTLALTLFIVGLACQTSDRVLSVAQAKTATPTRTRTPRPTFTLVPPSPTNTPVPPTPTTAPSRTPTRRPTARPTLRPTVPPAPPPPPVVVPTAFPYVYHSYFDHCEHSGNSWIKGAVVADKNDPSNTKIGGVKLRLSTSPDGGAIVDVESIDDYAFVLSGVGEGARPGTYYVWVIDGSGNRISEVSPAIVLNNLPDTNPATCWAAWVWFWKEPGR